MPSKKSSPAKTRFNWVFFLKTLVTTLASLLCITFLKRTLPSITLPTSHAPLLRFSSPDTTQISPYWAMSSCNAPLKKPQSICNLWSSPKECHLETLKNATTSCTRIKIGPYRYAHQMRAAEAFIHFHTHKENTHETQ